MSLLFAGVERGDGGFPNLAPPDYGPLPAAEELCRSRMCYGGSTDPGTVARLWGEERARPAAGDKGVAVP